MNTNTLKESQIKGEMQLTDLVETVNFLSEKFHQFEADRKLKKKELDKSSHSQVSVLDDDFKKMEAQIDQQAQYSRRNCLLIHGIKEKKYNKR